MRQAITEKGLDPSEVPLHPISNETLSGVVGQMLKRNGAEQGPDRPSRLDGVAKIVPMRSFRRGDIYAVLTEISNKKPKGLPL